MKNFLNKFENIKKNRKEFSDGCRVSKHEPNPVSEDNEPTKPKACRRSYTSTKKIRLVKAFTLAEALISIVVLGVVAALTIPMIQAKKDRREWMTGLNKSYNTLSNGLKNSEALYGKIANWDTNFLKYLKDAFKIQEECIDNDCVPDEKYLNHEPFILPDNTTSYILPDNQVLSVEVLDTTCSQTYGGLNDICGKIYLDINNKKGPNTWGKDYFGFFVTKNGIVPFGSSKIDLLKPNFEYVSQGCHGQDNECNSGSSISCENAQTDEETCTKCDGTWISSNEVTYSTPVEKEGTSYSVATYQTIYAPVYALNRETLYNYHLFCQIGDEATCWYTHTRYGFYPNWYWRSRYRDTYFIDSYKVESYAAESFNTYTFSCSGNAQNKVCNWDCWQQDGEPIENTCNDLGTASEASCPTKDFDALEDCDIDDKGTSCGAWAIYQGNMIYLDAKEVNW